MNIVKKLLTNNDCYKANRALKPAGIVVHDTGCNNKNVSRYLSSWNRAGVKKCVHAFIGIYDGSVRVVQTLPYTVRPWGCGKGSKGSYNASHIQFEICEDDKKDAAYFAEVYKTAVQFCATLCSAYQLPVSSIVDHKEAHALGYASNHGDVADWFPLHGKNMDTFRADVKAVLNGHKPDVPTGLDVDGWFGKDTIARTQEALGVPVTGAISNQPPGNKVYLPAATSGWSWSKSYKPSETVKAMQRLFGCDADGYFGKDTVKAMRRFLGMSAWIGAKMDRACVKAWQTWLNER